MNTRAVNTPVVDSRAPESQAVPGAGVSFEEAARMKREIETLRARLSGLSEAALRITGELDLGSVLQRVIDEARWLTGARYGALLILDGTGGIEDFITSGITPQEIARIQAQPQVMGLLSFLSEIEEPLRLRDIASHPNSIGFPEGHPPMRSFLGTPVFHLGERLGNIYLTEKEDSREFTAEDEETIAVFASHAAVAISNARRHRNEWQAKADLEALLDTSPVAVLVHDAKTKALLSLNQETRRIVRGMRPPGRSEAELHSVMSFQYPDGHEMPPEETPTYRAIRTGESMRAEEMVIKLANGQSVSTIVNATPVFSEQGEVVSVITTIQDMTPLERLERLRSQFIGMVSHELRTPLAAIKGSSATALSASYALGHSEMLHFFRVVDEQADRMRELISHLLDMTQVEAGALSVTPEPTEVADLVEGARRDFLRGGATNTIESDLPPGLPLVQVDRQRMAQVLNNLFTHASKNSPDWSAIKVSVSADDVRLFISVADEGRGLPDERLRHLFRKFSPVDGGIEYGQTLGESLGLVISKGIVEAHGGRIWAESGGPGQGTRFTFTIPSAEVPAIEQPAEDLGRPPDATERTARGRERILVVDNEPHILLHLRNTLRDTGYTPTVTSNPKEMERLIETENPHLILLDLAPSGVGGIEMMERIRGFTDAPVILMSERADHEDAALALEMGADDYIVKPFSPVELVARIKTALRRQSTPDRARSPGPYLLGDLMIDYAERLVTVAGRPVQLTSTEYELLSDLSLNAGRVLTHDQLLQRVWGPGYSGDSQPVRTFVKNLRNKLGDDARNPTYIFTEPRIGYRMAKSGGGGGSKGG